MKSRSNSRQFLFVLLALVLAQFACSFGTAAPTAGPTQLPASQPTSSVPHAQPSAAAPSVHGTPAEAQAMLQKAVEHYNTVGRAQALADFTGRIAPFFDRDLAVVCMDSHLVITADGGFPSMVGASAEPLNQDVRDTAAEDKMNSINYASTDPATGKTEAKTLYYEKVGSDVCGVEAYRP